ncbi:dnaJ homolog subfamily C member 2 isoform X2 [Columba livia]|uniref:dnaJ homolog subfamily C member 2 isoform X2 n=1 Tax=Columba livia TaxID=8932 RepID=UPI0031BA88F8
MRYSAPPALPAGPRRGDTKGGRTGRPRRGPRATDISFPPAPLPQPHSSARRSRRRNGAPRAGHSRPDPAGARCAAGPAAEGRRGAGRGAAEPRRAAYPAARLHRPGSARRAPPCAGSRQPARLGQRGPAPRPGAAMLRGARDGQLTAVTRPRLAASVLCQVEPVGRWFEAFIKRRNINVSSSFQELEDEKELSEESGDEELQLEEFPMLKTLDPKDWKNQDHYAVLGLGNIRYRATQKQIKAAHKSMVLKHHPDKRKAAGEQIGEGDNDYFTCITKAYEILSDPVKRRAFNSIDPTFDNSVPSKSEAKENFFEVFSPVFERNARWSNKKNVPKLGDMNSSFEEVDAFYSFWYNFDSWREFSYLDEEEKEKAECRDERRWIEKQNRAARALRKKEEMNRIRTLVDNAYSCDPRIKKFKEEEKAKKEAEKKAKVEAKRKEQEAKEKQRQAELEAARLAKEKEEEEFRQQALVAKKEKEIQKKAIKKERQKLRTTCKNWNYFSDNEADCVKMMEEVEKLCDRLELAR